MRGTGLLLLALTSSVLGHAGHDHGDHQHEHDAPVADDTPIEIPSAIFQITTIKGTLVEQFSAPDWSSRWVASEAKKVVDGVEDDDLLRYRGIWAVEEPTVLPGITGDKALVIKTAAAHHAISYKFDKPIDPTGKPLVIQYEVKLQNGLECGGAYMKLLTYDPKFEAGKFQDSTPYTIMFGPDKCGFTNKVHFIFRHKSPKSGEIEEKHMNAPPQSKTDKLSNLYTLIVHPNNTFFININEEQVKTGSLLEDFTPSVNPPKEIDDPEDKKPADWIDEPKIADPDATKPDDWDEDAPLEVADDDATKPGDWLDDEPETIPDPEAEKPDDWDDEEDGDWVAPTVANPKCEKASGCGVWKRPMKRNLAYKGKWRAPQIDNPAYKGEWKPRKIANKNYFEDLHPANFQKIGGIGFELWTMQDGISFDNIYVGSSIEDAAALAKESWDVKYKIEKANEASEAPKPPKDEKPVVDDGSVVGKVTSIFETIRQRVVDFVVAASKDPIKAAQEAPEVAVGLIATGLLPVLLMFLIIGGGSSEPAAPSKKETKASKEKDEDETGESTEDEPKKETKATKRTAKKAAASEDD
ncbi:hypothetical protein SmJEL517_g04993 [Synchytrium microbalum]|uniref:Calnexin n=1 Tax=Synchytrium microbalum TaxID=1806994 RepID=A0A507BW78_9FUNG|nr:uncharacterized protein SmJEL517_g04993 [Synchytrium microbalum]TPX31722.1 hypothetical protein SmJEL517_g04993 [Synchytrium microbalum]